MQINEYTLADLAVGQTERLQVEVLPETVDRFAALSGDHSPVHVDRDYAEQRGFPGRIAHGMLLGAYVSALIGTLLPGKHGLLQSCELEFRRPLVPPDRIDIVGEITGISLGTGQVSMKIIIRSEAGVVLAMGKVKTLVRTADSSGGSTA
jgi:3-hydroxybutyryl-CoA dehydratase